ncbi:hypothetical protein ACOBV9_20090 (plasmid) [Pseudoalteromonas espejiana]
MRNNYKMMLFITCSALVISSAIAKPMIPNDDDIIATSNSSISANLTLEQLSTLVINSQYIGQTERYQGVLKNRLAVLTNKPHGTSWVLICKSVTKRASIYTRY